MTSPVRLAVLTLVALALAPLALTAARSSAEDDAVRSGDDALGRAFDHRAQGLPVEGVGTVIRILADDAEDGRHQRFVVGLASGQTLLVAHNIDVAPRVEDLHVGDTVEFHGVYEWSEEGGTVHWTHHDPDGSHAPGWVIHEGETRQ